MSDFSDDAMRDYGEAMANGELYTPKDTDQTIEQRLDEILDLAGFQIFPAGANKDRAKAKQQIQVLIAKARIELLDTLTKGD